MFRKFAFATLPCLVLLCFVLTSPLWGQSNASLISLIETNLVRNSGMIYMIVPAPLNDEPGQGEYYLVFYVGVVSPSPGVTAQTHGMTAVQQSNGVFSAVPTVPVRDSVTGNIVMTMPFAPDLLRGDDNLSCPGVDGHCFLHDTLLEEEL
jgi:hypothetical protein